MMNSTEKLNGTEQEFLDEYFSTIWLDRKPEFDNYQYTGWSLLDKIGEHELVLDVGCGNNYFKGHRNVYGIDPANSQADEMVTIENFETDRRFDVALCLGSVNFGSDEKIRQEIEKILQLLAADGRIYWRCNPGLQDHGNSEFTKVHVFPWSFEYHQTFAAEFGCSIVDLKWDSGNRIYAEWKRD